MNNNNKKGGSLGKLDKAEKGSKVAVVLAVVGGAWKVADWIIGYSGKKTEQAYYKAKLGDLETKGPLGRFFNRKRIKELERKINDED